MPEHLAVPFRYDATGSAVTIAQDSIDDVAQCVRVLLSTPTGTRVEQFDYGIPDPTFTDDAALVAQITGAVARWEPRAAGLQVQVAVGADGAAVITAKIPEGGR